MQKRNLTRDKIGDAAIRFVESEGLEKLSMRNLAAKLNIEAASLYNHIKNKADLLDLIQEHLYSQLAADYTEKSWQNHLRALAHATRHGLLKYPGIVTLFATRPTVTTSSLIQVEKTLKVLLKAGFKSSEVMMIYRNFHVFILGHVLAEVGRVPGEIDSSHEPKLENINMEHYPVLKKVHQYKSNTDFEKGFKMGLEMIIKGLELNLKK